MKASKEKSLRELWQRLLEQKPSNVDLRYIIRWVEPLREVAGQRLLEQKPSNIDLCYIISYIEPLREVAKKYLKLTTGEILTEMKNIVQT